MVGNIEGARKEEQQGIEDELCALLPRMKSEALYLTHDIHTADDLLQKTCLRVLSRAHQHRPEGRFSRWVSTIMQNIWFDELREKNKTPEADITDPDLVIASDLENEVEAKIFASEIMRFLSAEETRLVLKIHTHGYTYQEVADQLNIPIGTVLSHVARAKAKMRKGRDETW